jgi:hypothetical protein
MWQLPQRRKQASPHRPTLIDLNQRRPNLLILKTFTSLAFCTRLDCPVEG